MKFTGVRPRRMRLRLLLGCLAVAANGAPPSSSRPRIPAT